MASPAERFLSSEEQRQVTAAVQEAEKRTSGEIVPLIASRSGRYRAAAITAALTLTIPGALLLSYLIGTRMWLGSNNVWLFLVVALILQTAFYPLCFRIDRLKRPFLGRRETEETVLDAALATFYREGLHRTAGANGILIYISVLEERVWILADHQINARIGQEVWDRLVDELTAAIRAGQRCAGICATVRQIGEILHEQFPGQRGDVDELHNLILR